MMIVDFAKKINMKINLTEDELKLAVVQYLNKKLQTTVIESEKISIKIHRQSKNQEKAGSITIEY